ncbi:hypothetical protein Hypma_001260 [Hypsizygus marmoreus]|uniref:Uncharacterized protein n=1 Tax=Hypsizygus marmoreus TaxID=39966 RepID=A0A369JA74_HYPMA|nr:hypothetical protein Hypma_001260 [Hypsizygus marmoreus]
METVPSPAATPPALERVLPYIISGTSAAISAVSAISHFTGFLISKATSSFLAFSPLPIIFYFLAPAFVFFEIATDVFLRFPYQVALYLLDAFYPIYVFCGVACITGALVGVTGRLVAGLLVDLSQGAYWMTPTPAPAPATPVAPVAVKKEKRVRRRRIRH